MRSILIIGLGRFGRHLAATFSELENELMVIDKDESAVNKIAPYVTAAQIGDCTDEFVLKDLEIDSYDLCFVCISNDLESSMIITMMLKELGAGKVVTKVNQDLHAKFLLSNGADAIIYPERDMAVRTAMKYDTKDAFDYVELNSTYGIFEMATPKKWIGHNLTDINVRKKYDVNIIAYKIDEKIFTLNQGNYQFSKDHHLIVAGDKESFQKLLSKKL